MLAGTPRTNQNGETSSRQDFSNPVLVKLALNILLSFIEAEQGKKSVIILVKR